MYTSWNIKSDPRKGRQCLADRMELAKRFRGMLADLGLKPAQAAKMLHVSLRTVHNWSSGKHQIPVMAYKLLRMLRYMELPGKSWEGWHFSRGMLISPEGRQISGKDSSWWSLLIRRAHCFTELYQRHKMEKLQELYTVQASGLAAAGSVPDAGLVSVSTTHTSQSDTWGQNGVIMGSWPTISDFPPLSMPTHENAASASESALTPCFASPWMPTSGSQNPQSAKHPEVSQTPQTGQHLASGTSTPDIPGLRLPPLPVLLHLINPPSPDNLASSPSPSAGKLPGSNAKPANSDGQALGRVAA